MTSITCIMAVRAPPGHDPVFLGRGGQCTKCVLESPFHKLFNCQCGQLVGVCSECIYEHRLAVREEARRK